MRIRLLLIVGALPWAMAAQAPERPLDVLPAQATTALVRSLQLSSPHAMHVWRDTAPMNDDGTVNAYVEITQGDRRKWEFDMSANARTIDRVIPVDIGGYPVNYGFVPQTISYDGDPFDALVIGPPLPGGRLVRGVIVGLMYMEDEKGLDSKVVLSPVARGRRPLHLITPAVQNRIGEYFDRYKLHEPGGFSNVSGWGSPQEGLAHITRTHAFFAACRHRAGAPCSMEPQEGAARPATGAR